MKKRIMALLLIMTLIVEVTAIIAVSENFKVQYSDEIMTNLTGYANIIALNLPPDANYQKLAQNYSRAAKNGLRVTFLNRSGDVLADTAVNGSAVENHLDRPEVKDAIESGTGSAMRASKTMGQQMLYVAKSLDNGDILRLSMPLKNSAVFITKAIPLAALVTALLFICAYAAADRLTKRLLTPLVSLHNAVSGYLTDKKPFAYENAYPETEEIASAFAKLCSQIEDYIADVNAGRRKLELVLENIKEGLIICDGEGNVFMVNRTALEICGLKQPPKDSHLLYYLSNASLIEEIESAYALGNNTYIDRTDEKTGRDYRYHLIFVAENAFLPHGGGLFILITDRTEEALAEKVRADFASNVSHELKTPLTSINGYAQLISNGMVGDADAVKKYAGAIVSQADRLIGLINDTLELSKLDAIRVADLRREDISLYDTAVLAADMLSGKATEKNVRVDIEGDAVVRADGDRLLRLMYNLLENAVKYGKKQGIVQVLISQNNNTAEISVKDDGIGIPAAEIPRVFERFYRASNAGAGAVEGTGLGLAIVKHIAKIYGGGVSLTSDLGKGSTFTVKLKVN